MAIAGGATKAYKFQVKPDKSIEQREMTTLRSLCDGIEDGLESLKVGGVTIIAAGDVFKFQAALRKAIEDGVLP